MRNRRRTWFLRRLVLGFAVALVAVPVAQARPDEGTSTIQQGGLPMRGDVKDGLGATTNGAVIVGDDKRGLPGATTGLIVGDDKKNVPLGVNYEPTVAAEYHQFAYRQALPQELGPQAAVLAELDAKTREYVAGAAPVVDEPVQVVSNTSDGFDWGDAGIGAGTIFAVMLLGVGAVLITRRVSHPASV
jgi:hypothetical protein